MKIFAPLFGLLLPLHVAFAGNVTCQSEPWRISNSISLREFKKLAEKIPRNRLIQMAWGEALRKDPQHSMSVPLLDYLLATEQSAAVRGYYKTLLASVLEPTTTREALATWPKRPRTQKTTPLGLKDLCSLYFSAL